MFVMKDDAVVVSLVLEFIVHDHCRGLIIVGTLRRKAYLLMKADANKLVVSVKHTLHQQLSF